MSGNLSLYLCDHYIIQSLNNIDFFYNNKSMKLHRTYPKDYICKLSDYFGSMEIKLIL